MASQTSARAGALALWLTVLSMSLACKRGAPQPPSPSEAACGPMDCHLYDTAGDAVRFAVRGGPLIVGIGEAHAPKGVSGVDSSAKRFAESLLPLFRGWASDIVVELMLPPQGCVREVTNVRTTQRPITEHQADSDQAEYLMIGDAARRLGIVPDLLRPTCADLEAIASAGDDVVARSLETIKRLTVKQVRALLARSDRDPAQCILVYGGALHNDPAPRPERAPWSYAAELSAATDQRYVAIDLFVPEFMQDDESWRTFDWFAYYDRTRPTTKATMLHPSPAKYVIIFPQR